MLRTAQPLPLHRAFDVALRRRALPPDAGNLLPGPLAATRTKLPPTSDDELQTASDHVAMTVTSFHFWARSDRRYNSPVLQNRQVGQLERFLVPDPVSPQHAHHGTGLERRSSAASSLASWPASLCPSGLRGDHGYQAWERSRPMRVDISSWTVS